MPPPSPLSVVKACVRQVFGQPHLHGGCSALGTVWDAGILRKDLLENIPAVVALEVSDR